MPDAFAYFGGIDFSGAKEPLSNLWTALGREEEGGLTIVSLRPHAFRQDLCSYVADGWRSSMGAGDDDRILWGADFPFGLPADAAAHVCGERRWARLLDWIADRPADEVRDSVPEEMRGARLTDTGGAMSPFDLRLYKQTTEGIRWLQQLRDSAEIAVFPQQPLDDAPTALIEVYPSAAAHELGLPRRRAPSRPGEIRARAAALRTFLRFADPGDEAIAVVLEDAWDATLACLTAWLAREDLHQPFRASDHPRDTIELEGWIYRPPATVG
jgi:hypothetical protein